MNTNTETQTPKLATLNLLCAEALAVWGAVELAGGDTLISRTLVGGMMACMGLLMLRLARLAVTHASQLMRRVALGVATLCLAVMLGDLYMFLLSRANGAEERAGAQVQAVATATTEADSLRTELSAWQATLARELASGPGPKAKLAQERVDGLRAKLDTLQRSAETASTEHQHRAPLLVACERFDWSTDIAIKVILGLVVFVGTVPAYVMLFAGATGVTPHMGHDTAPAPVRHVAEPVRHVAAPRVLPGHWEPAPAWLADSRARIQLACEPDALTVAIGKRKRN